MAGKVTEENRGRPPTKQRTDDPAPPKSNKPLKQVMAESLQTTTRIARFKGTTLIEEDGLWRDMTSDRFSEACYKLFGAGINKSRISDLEHLFRTTSEDLSDRAHLISFGGMVWDTKKLDWAENKGPEDCVYRVPYQPTKPEEDSKLSFIMDLACGDEGVYKDIMQSVAPIIMDKKPTGVIWYLGSGANGKSTLVHLLYLIFNHYLTELTVKQLEDERDTPQLNGKLANVCKESSEGFVEDTRTYKSIGTHEGFSVHKFHSQDMVEIEGNVHHIFSANNIPTFGDKSYGARRRTLVVPFNNRFKPDETFEDKTFTTEFIESFLGEVIKYALLLKEQNYEFKFSPTTQAMKEKYDTDANTAQTYADELVAQDIYAFRNFRLLQVDYENWSSEHGYKASSINVLRKAIDEQGFARASIREDGRINKIYIKGDHSTEDFEETHIAGRLGMYRLKESPHKEESEDLDDEEKQDKLEEWSKENDQASIEISNTTRSLNF